MLGGTGWFGATMLHLVGRSAPTLATSSRDLNGYVRFERHVLEEFAPTVVANFAFLTREKVAAIGRKAFTATNLTLTRDFLWAAQLPNVRLALTVSSGAALTEPSHPYGALKAAEEEQALGLASATRASVILRAYSVSGPYVRRPEAYAFSDLIRQCAAGRMHVNATRPTFRRYVDVEDALNVCLALGLSGGAHLVETGGDLIEIGELADRIRRIVNPAARLSREPLQSHKPSTYASDNQSWTAACLATEVVPRTLDAQIEWTFTGLPGTGR